MPVTGTHTVCSGCCPWEGTSPALATTPAPPALCPQVNQWHSVQRQIIQRFCFLNIWAQLPRVLEEPLVCGENRAPGAGPGAPEIFLEKMGGMSRPGVPCCVQLADHHGGRCLGTGHYNPFCPSLAQRLHGLRGPHSQFGEGRPGLEHGAVTSGPQGPRPALCRNRSGGPHEPCHPEVSSVTASLGAEGPSLNRGSLGCTTLNPNTRQVLGSTPSSGR